MKSILINAYNKCIIIHDNNHVEEEDGILIANCKYLGKEDYVVARVNEIPTDFEPYKYMYDSEKGIYKNPDYFVPETPEQRIARLEGQLKEQTLRNRQMEADNIAFQDYVLSVIGG